MGNVRDMVCGMQQVLDDSAMDIKPSIAGEEWVVHNIYIPFGKSVGVYKTKSGLSILIIQTTMSLIGQFNFHCNSEEYLTLVNDSGESLALSFDGTVTRVS